VTFDSCPALTGQVAPIRGRIRHDPEDFCVDEVPAYDPSGDGPHLFVRFEKRELNTREAVRRLARALGVPEGAASFAGMKDRRAVTTQWASFEGAAEDVAAGAAVDGVRVLEWARHPNRLRTGHLRANRFRILVREVPEARWADLQSMLATLCRRGVPNYYEAQRFGWDGGNLTRAQAWWLEGRRPPRDRTRRKWDVSVLQSWLFNEVLADRIRDGALDRAIVGDLMRREATGGLFVSESPEEDQPRLEAWDISPTGPMFGPRMRWPAAEAREKEEAVLTRTGVTSEHLQRFGRAGRGTRRPLRVCPAEAQMEWTPEGVALQFTLPTGAYATALLRELFKDGLEVADGKESHAPVVDDPGA
jgi:tRNA pseudouridine13 synthase